MNDLSQTVRRLLDERGKTLADMAAAIGLSPVSVWNQVRGVVHLRNRSRKIESYLGAAVWTPVERFAQLNRASEILGADAVLTNFHELRGRAIGLRVPKARLLTSKDRLVDAVLAHFSHAK